MKLVWAVGLGHVMAAHAGVFIWNVEPFSIVDPIQMGPPCITTICLAVTVRL